METQKRNVTDRLFQLLVASGNLLLSSAASISALFSSFLPLFSCVAYSSLIRTLIVRFLVQPSPVGSCFKILTLITPKKTNITNGILCCSFGQTYFWRERHSIYCLQSVIMNPLGLHFRLYRKKVKCLFIALELSIKRSF